MYGPKKEYTCPTLSPQDICRNKNEPQGQRNKPMAPASSAKHKEREIELPQTQEKRVNAMVWMKRKPNKQKKSELRWPEI